MRRLPRRLGDGVNVGGKILDKQGGGKYIDTMTTTQNAEFSFTECPTDVLVAFARHFAETRQIERMTEVVGVMAARGVEVTPR
jgi:hypothetical protein